MYPPIDLFKIYCIHDWNVPLPYKHKKHTQIRLPVNGTESDVLELIHADEYKLLNLFIREYSCLYMKGANK